MNQPAIKFKNQLKPHPLHGLKLPRHSLSDWDFYQVVGWAPLSNYELYLADFVSPPSSLIMWQTGAGGYYYALSKLSQAQDLKAGRIVNWSYRGNYPLTESNVYFGVTGPGSLGIRVELWGANPPFLRRRVTWWQGFNLLNEPATLYFASTWDGSNWTDGSIAYADPMTGPVNRVGIGGFSPSIARWSVHDDTEIWIPS